MVKGHLHFLGTGEEMEAYLFFFFRIYKHEVRTGLQSLSHCGPIARPTLAVESFDLLWQIENHSLQKWLVTLQGDVKGNSTSIQKLSPSS